MPINPEELFADFTPGVDAHFRICYFGSVLGVMEGAAAAAGSFEKAVERFPFLAEYNNELAERLAGLSSSEALARWCDGVEVWERGVTMNLPLRGLRRAAGLSHADLIWSLIPGLVEEDGRFGVLFEELQGAPGQRRPTFGFMCGCLARHSERDRAVALLARLAELGALHVMNPEAPRPEWIARFPNVVWDALRVGKIHLDSPRLRYRPPESALTLEQLVLPSELRAQVGALPSWLDQADGRTLVVRGPRHNGRRTLLGAIARARGQGVLELTGTDPGQASPSNEAGILAVMLNAMPVVEVTGSQAADLPDLRPSSLSLGVAISSRDGLRGARGRDAVILDLPLPGVTERRELWRRSTSDTDAAQLANRFRLTTGNLHRAGEFARTRATLAGRGIEPADVLAATRALDRQDLETLSQRLPAAGNLSRLSVGKRTRDELNHLASRCRHRESLPATLEQGPAGRLNCGVRALLTGPSGTGKTLAARLLAGTLNKDIYRLALSSVVNKFIGETEKALERLFEAAEALDVILLLDEGDSLLTKRTDVQTANDRYANLETNYLLQRMESFQGILLVTTNARERIDAAFERRMEVVVEFGLPSAEERWELWHSHLPASSAIDPQRLSEVAGECELSGGQIHNAVVHATLLALDNGGIVTGEYLEAAVRREYRKRGNVCPLRSG